MSTEDKGKSFNESANQLFLKNEYQKALELYNKAVESEPNNHLYIGNRAMCHLKLENFGLAIEDASKAVELDPKYVKGYYRRASAYFALAKYDKAMVDFKKALELQPNITDAQIKLKQCKKEIFKSKFSEAISRNEEKQTIEIDSIDVPDSYNGPRIGEKIDEKFVNELRQAFCDRIPLHKKFCYQILIEAKKILEKKQSLEDITIPEGSRLTVCGDVHGQYFDMVNIFKLNGYPSETNMYLFNGDFVDRGCFSTECALLLLSYVVLYPNHFFLTRGNHESRSMNKIYGFEEEVKDKYTESAFELFQEVFCALPLAYVIMNKVLVLHGGLFSQDGVKLEDIRNIDRFREPPSGTEIMSDLLWADPQKENGRSPSKRGQGLSFGPDITAKFLDDNGLDMLIRSHEMKEEGYEIEANGRLVTVFSAPNYCGFSNNLGAYIIFEHDMKPVYKQFSAQPQHPEALKKRYVRF